jgi:lipopolysaccharide biosynthesis protein
VRRIADERHCAGAGAPCRPTVLAFHLPQFHPIPENDQWWGQGFTEWTNVVKARPRFPGHYQPHLPADLGFYDLRVPEVRERQADLARDAGITGFAYYHYWFNGRQLLDRPVTEVLRTGEPQFPFLLVWANENWTRRWDGAESEVLLRQDYSKEDDLDHIRALRTALCDERYLRRNGKPMLAIYRASLLPSSLATTDLWRQEAESWGLPGLYLIRVESSWREAGDPRSQGFDSAVDFQPAHRALPHPALPFRVRRLLSTIAGRRSDHVASYRKFVANVLNEQPPPYLRWPCVTPGFDNSPRRSAGAWILKRPSPEIYRLWLAEAVRRSHEAARQYERRRDGLLFINAWNEWAEGNHLEPDQRFGHSFLDATRAVLCQDRVKDGGAI